MPDYQPDLTALQNAFKLQLTEVWAQSEELTIAEQPFDFPLYGTCLDLDEIRPDLVGVQVVALSGNRQKLSVKDGATNLVFVPDDNSGPTPLNPGDVLAITSPQPLPLNPDGSIPDWGSATALSLSVADSQGRPGTIASTAPILLKHFELAPSGSSDPEVSEYAIVTAVTTQATVIKPRTRLLLQKNLVYCYDRTTTTVNANVGLATHGQTVTEILGSGSASTPNQSFTLQHSPLTFVQAATPTGRQSTLQVRANGTLWNGVPSLFGQGPTSQAYAKLVQSDASTDVLFGDGVEGALLPTGTNNIQATYRYGLGSAGNVAGGALSTLLDRPLGVSGVTNPQPASGGQDADSVDDVRAKAPQSVLTLGRAVSITDYQNFASTFAGIAKAYALWIPGGPGRGVFVTVAGVDGVGLQSGNPTLANLESALQSYGNSLIPVIPQTFMETLFGLSANIAYAPTYDAPTVQNSVLQALYQNFSFAQRSFGDGVSADEVAVVIQSVAGVIAVNVVKLWVVASSTAGDLAGVPGGFTLANFSNWLALQVPRDQIQRPAVGPTRICPYLPVASVQALPLPAEILVLDPDPSSVILGVMP